MSLIQKCLVFFIEEIERNDCLQINKLFQLNKFFEVKSEKNIVLEDFKIEVDNNKFLKEIKEIISGLNEENNKILQNFEEGKSIMNFNEKYFNSYPLNLLQIEPILIEKGTFNPNNWKSNVSTTFMINDETFIVWPGDEEDKNYFPLHVYNISSMKKEVVIKTNTDSIRVLSIYPKEANYNSKKWLYTGDRSGVLRVFDLAKETFFQEIQKIETKKSILSAVIFDDKFDEIAESKKKDTMSGIYAMISFFDSLNSPMRIYKLNGEEKGQLVMEIPNPLGQYCCTINFYHDEIRSKSCFSFGFSNSFVKIYDLKSKVWVKEFESQDAVLSINFVFRNNSINQEKIEPFMVFTQGNNSIVLADINKGTIIKQVSLQNISCVRDLCVWDPLKNNFLIIATDNQNTLKVLNFENLKILASKETINNSVPVNLIKVLKKDQKTKEIKECIVLCQGQGSDSQILLYE